MPVDQQKTAWLGNAWQDRNAYTRSSQLRSAPSSDETDAQTPEHFKVAIIGGGPAGLFAAWHLAAKAGGSCQITIYEAGDRPGGKIVTREFPGIGLYEAGVAEIYDYSCVGPDGLRDLITKDLWLEVKYLEGGPVVLDGKIVLAPEDLAKHFGKRTYDEVNAFYKRCVDLLSPEEYYLSRPSTDNAHPWAQISAQAALSEIKDDTARRYIRASAHSDVAAPPRQTNALTLLKNVVLDIKGYMDVLSVIGGNEQIVTRLVEELDAEIHLNTNVVAVGQLPDGNYSLELRVNGSQEKAEADFVVVALPLTALSTIHWRSNILQRAVDRHISYFDWPAHYLRATLLFERPFWREHIDTDWWYLDAFDGCCAYDESARHDHKGWGVLAFLIAGNAALALANLPDERIEQMCLDALPPALAEGKDLIVDRRIHRWMASVSALPGGLRVRHRDVNHRIDAERLPGVVMVGDYIFDATLNGAFDSADVATDILVSEILARRHASSAKAVAEVTAAEEALERLCPAEMLSDILTTVWGLKKGSKILHLGSGSGRLVSSLRALGYDAVGVERSDLPSVETQSEFSNHNFGCEFDKLPFENLEFDAVIETGLYRLPRNQITDAAKELRRVVRRGVVLGSVTTDLPIELIERYGLLEGAQMLRSRWDWSEILYDAGFVHALQEVSTLDAAWKIVEAAGAGQCEWYGNAEGLLYCIYDVAPVARLRSKEAEDYFPVALAAE